MRICWLFLLPFALAACNAEAPSNVTAPGGPESAKARALEAGAQVLQNKPPIESLNAYLDGFHFYSGNMSAQTEAHHYCSFVNDDVTQCVIYDGNEPAAKLMGVEYIVSEQLFAALPEAEKPLWHSHVYEVKSGQLVAPGIPQLAEHELMEKLVHTYGKTWHLWHTDMGNTLPLGVPQLMMGFTEDGQADPALTAARDRRLGSSTAERKAAREDIPAPPVSPGANGWQHGNAIQIADPTAAAADSGAEGSP
ncbi:MAG TPA: OBAP family protein [Gammaproteobacteria bacterium]|nr:OBAP family protein [Gammaproteobacteria bacterium]